MIEYNHLDLIGERELEWLPPHFSKYNFPPEVAWYESLIRQWIRANTKGRFYILKIPKINLVDNKLVNLLQLGFETHNEMTYFMLACPHLRKIR